MTGDAPTTPTSADADDLLRIQACPSCGYSLAGHPPEGRCPECGTSYDSRAIVLYGWGRGVHGNVNSGRPKTFIFWALIGAACIVFAIYGIRAGDRIFPAVILAQWVFFAVRVWLRRRTVLPGLAQVHLSPDGCRQLDWPTQTVFETPWIDVEHVTLTSTRDGYHRIQSRRAVSWLEMNWYVDADVQCTEARAKAIRARVAEWRRAEAAGRVRATAG